MANDFDKDDFSWQRDKRDKRNQDDDNNDQPEDDFPDLDWLTDDSEKKSSPSVSDPKKLGVTGQLPWLRDNDSTEDQPAACIDLAPPAGIAACGNYVEALGGAVGGVDCAVRVAIETCRNLLADNGAPTAAQAEPVPAVFWSCACGGVMVLIERLTPAQTYVRPPPATEPQ